VLVPGVEYRAAGIEVALLLALLRLAHALPSFVIDVDVAVGIHSHLSGGFVGRRRLNARLRHLAAQVVSIRRGLVVGCGCAAHRNAQVAVEGVQRLVATDITVNVIILITLIILLILIIY